MDYLFGYFLIQVNDLIADSLEGTSHDNMFFIESDQSVQFVERVAKATDTSLINDQKPWPLIPTFHRI